jgi:hypothetical protein
VHSASAGDAGEPGLIFSRRDVVWLALVGIGIAVVAWTVAKILPSSQATTLAAVVSALAAVAVALYSAVLLRTNMRLIAATLRMAEATQREADATVREAEETARAAKATLEQAELAREALQASAHAQELEWRPLVAMEPNTFGSTTGPEIFEVKASFVNVGRGAAVNCGHAYTANGLWSYSPLFNIPAGESRQITTNLRGAPLPAQLFGLEGSVPASPVRHVVVCQDGLGDKLFRFVDGRAGFDVWHGRDPKPPWAEEALNLWPSLELRT